MATPASTTRNLYSLSDRPLIVDLGQFGNVSVNARPEGAPWGVTVFEPRQIRVDLGDDKNELKIVSADSLVNDLVVRYSGEGIFIAAEDDSPTADEIEKATVEFDLTDQVRITKAHQVWDQTHDRSKIDARARDAARRRHQTVDWAVGVVVELKTCPYCGENIRASAIKCKHCASFVNVPPPGPNAPAPALPESEHNESSPPVATAAHSGTSTIGKRK